MNELTTVIEILVGVYIGIILHEWFDNAQSKWFYGKKKK